MLHLSIMELFLRVIPESTILLLGTHIFSGTTMCKTKLIKSIVFTSIIIYFIRCLPITFGIHTLLGVLSIIFAIIIFHKIELIKAIKAVFLTMFIQYICEIISMIWIQLYLDKELEVIFSNPTTKILYGIPSLLISGSILCLYYLKTKHRKELMSNEN